MVQTNIFISPRGVVWLGEEPPGARHLVGVAVHPLVEPQQPRVQRRPRPRGGDPDPLTAAGAGIQAAAGGELFLLLLLPGSWVRPLPLQARDNLHEVLEVSLGVAAVGVVVQYLYSQDYGCNIICV